MKTYRARYSKRIVYLETKPYDQLLLFRLHYEVVSMMLLTLNQITAIPGPGRISSTIKLFQEPKGQRALSGGLAKTLRRGYGKFTAPT